MRFAVTLASLLLIIVVGGYAALTRTAAGQDWVVDTIMRQLIAAPPEFAQDSLNVIICGSASPLGVSNRAQACVAVLAGERLFLVDTGAGSVTTLSRVRAPLQKLEDVLITHFHSDHISALGDINLSSWVAGRKAAMTIHGPAGIDAVVDGFNLAYSADRSYRTAHHGADILPPDIAAMKARTIRPGVIYDNDELVITAFEVNHSPIEPAVGYRFDYRGRSVVISGDSVVTEATFEHARGADLLLHDALSKKLITTIRDAQLEAGISRGGQIVDDVLDYHAHTQDLLEPAAEAGVKTLALYHLVPAPNNGFLTRIFRRGLPSSVVVTEDGMLFELPADSDEVIINNLL